jgi:type II secretory pathway component PulM
LSDVLLYMRGMTNRERLLLSEVVKVLMLVLVMPVTNSPSERLFSTLQRIKTYLRSTMRQDRLNDLMILHVHKDKTDEMNFQSVARDFYFREYRQNIFGQFK